VRIQHVLLAALLVAGSVACGVERNPGFQAAPAGNTQPASSDEGDSTKKSTGSQNENETEKVAQAPAKPKAVDPRRGGFEIALGEWAVTPEAPAIRPGRVTFLIHNRGTMDHGFEIELEGDSSGSGSGDLFKAESELLAPGESTRMTVDLTMTGIYKIECLVDGHDDMGMEGPLEVAADAPLTKTKPEAATNNALGSVSISNFAFQPEAIQIQAGTEVTWSNDDPAPHTVTSLDDAFDSGTLDPNADFSFKFEKPGTYRYRCNVHPDMEGMVKVR
jgi:plastocyanin